MTKKKAMGWGMLLGVCMVMGCPSQRAHAIQVSLKFTSGELQAKDDLFAGTEKFAQGASDVTDVNLDARLMSMMGKQTSHDIAKKLDFIIVRSYTYDKPGMYKPEDLEAFQKRLTDGSWACFVHIRERKSGESTDICSRQAADKETNELVIITAEPKELTFVHIKGRMTVDDLRGMSDHFGVGNSSGSGSGSGSGSSNSSH